MPIFIKLQRNLLKKQNNKPRFRGFNIIFTGKIKKYKKRPLLKCIQHFKLDSINNMDHMRISGPEPLPVILSKRK